MSDTIAGSRRRWGRPDHGCVNARATNAATSALCSARARLAGTVRPSVAARRSPRGCAVSPRRPAHLRVRCRDAPLRSRPRSRPDRWRRARGSGPRGARRVASRAPRSARATPTTSEASSTRCGIGRPLERHQNMGNSSVRQPSTGTLAVSSDLERAGEVQERLRARADRHDRMRRDRTEIGADVAGAALRRDAHRRCHPSRTPRSRPPRRVRVTRRRS